MTRTIAAAAFLSVTMSVLPAYADDDGAAGARLARPVSPRVSQSIARPKALPALYASYAALQVFDLYSTKQAMARGAREANPLMQGVVGNTGAFVALKATTAVATIVAAERLWKTNKAAAIVVMVASNSVAAMVAGRNARTLRQLH